MCLSPLPWQHRESSCPAASVLPSKSSVSPHAPKFHVNLGGMDPGSAFPAALFGVLGPVLRAGGGFAVFIFQKGAESNQPVPWKRAGAVSAVSQQ